LGSGDIGSKIDREASFRLLDAFLGQGGNFLDTAKIYADWIPGIERSISEKTIGRWMKSRRNRASIILATKGAHPLLNRMDLPRVSPLEIQSDLEASLKNLQTEVIDLYWLHRDDPERPVEEILFCLDEQVKAGKIRYYGCSNWSVSRIRTAQESASRNNLREFVANQMLWNVGWVDYQAIGDPTIVLMDKEMWDIHRQQNLTAIPFSSQAGGYFHKLAQGLRANINPDIYKMYPIEKNYPIYKRIQKIQEKAGLSITQVVLGYLLSQPFITVPIVGCQNEQQLADSLSASEIRLSLI